MNIKPTAPEFEYHDERFAARYLGVSVSRLREWRNGWGRGPRFRKLGRSSARYMLGDLMAFAEAEGFHDGDRAPQDRRSMTVLTIGDKVLVRVYGGEVVQRRVVQDRGKTIEICNEEEYRAASAANRRPQGVGFQRSAVSTTIEPRLPDSEG